MQIYIHLPGRGFELVLCPQRKLAELKLKGKLEIEKPSVFPSVPFLQGNY
jgi:hypothetical protein